MQYFFIRIIYGIIQWESVCSHIFPADVWIYYGVPFGVAEIFRGNRRMSCSPTYGAFHAYADGISAMQASKTIYHYPVLSDISFSIKRDEKILWRDLTASQANTLYLHISYRGWVDSLLKNPCQCKGAFYPRSRSQISTYKNQYIYKPWGRDSLCGVSFVVFCCNTS